MNFKKLAVAVLFFVATAAQAVQFQDLQVKGGGYADWTPYVEGMALAAGNVQIKGRIIPDASENYGRSPGAGFFSTSTSNCVFDAATGAVNGYVNYRQIMANLETQGCIPTFQVLGYPAAMSTYYPLSFSSQFEVTVPLATSPSAIYYKLAHSIPTMESWFGEITMLWIMPFETRATLSFNAAAPATTMTDLLARAELKFPGLFPSVGADTVDSVEYHGSTWSARFYQTGWIIGINANNEVWYITPGTSTEVKFADTISAALSAIESM